MVERLENIDELFRDDLKNLTPEMPEGMWERIAEKIPSRKRRLIPIIWKIAAGAAIVIATGSIATYFIVSQPDNKSYTESNNLKIVLPETNQNEAPVVATEKNIATTQKKNAIYKPVEAKAVVPKNQTEALFSENVIVDQTQPQETIDSENESITKEQTPETIIIASEQNLQQETNLTNQETVSETVSNNEILANNIAEFEEYQEEKSDTKWLIGSQAGPQYTYRNISSETYSSSALAEKNETENGVVAYAGGINIEVQSKGRFSIQSGIYYSKIGTEFVATRNVQQTLVENSLAQPGDKDKVFVTTSVSYRFPNSSAKIVTTSSNTSSEYTNQPLGSDEIFEPEISSNNSSYLPTFRYQEYLEIPLIAKYAIINKKVGMQVLGGFSTNILVNNTGMIKDPDFGDQGILADDINSISFSSTFGLGMSYAISSKINMSIEPQFKYFLSKQQYDSNVDIHPYSIGVFTGVKYLF